MESVEFLSLVSPAVVDNQQHNAQVLSNIRSVSAALVGLVAGLFGFQSYAGFAFFAVSALVVELVVIPIWVGRTAGTAHWWSSRSRARSRSARSSAGSHLKNGCDDNDDDYDNRDGKSGRRAGSVLPYFDNPAVGRKSNDDPAGSGRASWRTGTISDWMGSTMQYILTWTLVYGIVGA